MAKERLDVLVVKNGLAPSREKAKAIIMAGEVLVDGQREDKAGMTFPETVTVTLKQNRKELFPFVSRGGLKLDKAVRKFEIDLADRVCMDVGASTGGFTDCMLQNGARGVYSVDVGRGQLDWKLREDPRVTVMEKTNIRYVTAADIAERPSFVSIDVSFISLTKVLLPVKDLMEETGELVCLIKPQFEAGREKVGKKGVVRDPKVHAEVIQSVILYAESIGLIPEDLDYSPIKGPEGNIEYLVHLRKTAESTPSVASITAKTAASNSSTAASSAETVDAEKWASERDSAEKTAEKRTAEEDSVEKAAEMLTEEADSAKTAADELNVSAISEKTISAVVAAAHGDLDK